MRILFVSDVSSWDGFKAVVDKVEPDVALFGGDLTSDGLAEFWHDALYAIPGFRFELLQFLEKHRGTILRRTYPEDRAIFDTIKRHVLNGRLEDVPVEASYFYADSAMLAIDMLFHRRSKYHRMFHAFMDSLTETYCRTPQFRTNRLHMHVDRFYEALEYVARVCGKVLVVSGDHEEDFEGDYNTERINHIRNCREISGQIENYEGLVFLGLGFHETHDLRRLRTFVETMRGHVDVVLAHAEESRLPLLAQIKPKIIFRGHFGSGKSKIGSVPIVAAAFPSHAMVEFARKTVKKTVVVK